MNALTSTINAEINRHQGLKGLQFESVNVNTVEIEGLEIDGIALLQILSGYGEDVLTVEMLIEELR